MKTKTKQQTEINKQWIQTHSVITTSKSNKYKTGTTTQTKKTKQTQHRINNKKQAKHITTQVNKQQTQTTKQINKNKETNAKQQHQIKQTTKQESTPQTKQQHHKNKAQ